VDELDLSGEEPTDAADPDIKIEEPPERATLLVEVTGWKPHVRVRWSMQGKGSWAPAFWTVVLVLFLLAPAATLLTIRLLPSGATRMTEVLAAAGMGGAVFIGGATFLLLWPRLRKR